MQSAHIARDRSPRVGLPSTAPSAEVVGALRVHPHKHDANYPPQKIEDLLTLGAFLLGDVVHVIAEIHVARICTASSSPAVCTLAFGTPL